MTLDTALWWETGSTAAEKTGHVAQVGAKFECRTSSGMAEGCAELDDKSLKELLESVESRLRLDPDQAWLRSTNR